MKILMVSDVYFPRINGVSTSIATFTRDLATLNVEVTLLVPDYGDPGISSRLQTALEMPGTEILRIPGRRVPFDPEDRFMRPRRLLELEARLRRRHFDLVHIQTPFVAHRAGIQLAERLGLPTIETYHTYFEQYLYHYVPLLPAPLLKGLARTFTRRQCNRVNSIIVPSTAMQEVLEGYGVETPINVLPTGLRLEEFARGDGARFRAKHGIPPTRPTLLHVGRVAFEKNIEFLFHVLDRVRQDLPEVLLVVAGEGPARSALRRRARSLGLSGNILFEDYLDRESELLDCYRAADAFVFASRTETQGLVLLEAMACGVPVVSTAVMGTKDVLRDAEGCLVAPEQVEGFAAQVLRLLGDSELRRQLAAGAARQAESWDSRAMAAQLRELYTQLVASHARPRRAA